MKHQFHSFGMSLCLSVLKLSKIVTRNFWGKFHEKYRSDIQIWI